MDVKSKTRRRYVYPKVHILGCDAFFAKHLGKKQPNNYKNSWI